MLATVCNYIPDDSAPQDSFLRTLNRELLNLYCRLFDKLQCLSQIKALIMYEKMIRCKKITTTCLSLGKA
eukprot:g48927.t1